MSTDRLLCTVLCAFGALILSACATTGTDLGSEVRVDKSAETDLSKCRTFDWHPASSDAASFTEQRVRAEALEQLEGKGYTLATEKPDCRITYVLATQDQPSRKPNVGVRAGGGSGGVGGGVGVSLPIGRRHGQAGTFTLDVIDVARNAQIWSGTVVAVFGAGELTEDEARAAVRVVLAEFPNRPASQ